MATLISGCAGIQPNYHLSPQAQQYLEEVLTLLQQHSVQKNQVNWAKFKQAVFQVAQNSQTIEDTYPAVAYAIAQLNDHHSYFAPAKPDTFAANEKPLPVYTDETTPNDIGYIRLPFCIGNKAQTNAYIQLVNNKITAQNNQHLKGWIVDLRGNFGGNMWPMMAAVGSLLHTGTQGYFIDADNHAQAWRYENGKACLDTITLAENKQILTLHGTQYIAVLINEETASSGEAMAVLFKGYANAKLFGAPTFGVSTGCEPFTLSDGSHLNLATSVFADKNHNKYGNAIHPDYPCPAEETLSKAIGWIHAQ